MYNERKGFTVHSSVVITFVLLAGPPCAAQVEADSVLSLVEAAIRKAPSIRYTASLSMKFTNMQDTFQFVDEVFLLRQETDSMFGGLIHFTTGDSSFKAYDGRYVFACDETTDSCTRFDPTKGETGAIKQDLRTMLIWWDFLDVGNIAIMRKPDRVRELLSDTIISGTDCWHVTSSSPPNQQRGEAVSNLYVSKIDHMVLLDEFRIDVNGDAQYSRRQLLSHQLKPLSKLNFTLGKLLPGAIVNDPVMPEREPALAVDDTAPLLVGDLYGSGPELDSIAAIGSITFVDFWYMSCPPCRMSVPIVDSLYTAFKHQDVRFIGVNTVDKAYGKLALLPEFLKKRPIHYDLLIGDETLGTAYRVTAHPTFYIIGKDGKVAASYAGYEKGLELQWAEKLNELLSRK